MTISILTDRFLDGDSDLLIRRRQIVLTCHASDADCLAGPFIAELESRGVAADRIRLSCYWTDPELDLGLIGSLAPINKTYVETHDDDATYVLLVRDLADGFTRARTMLARTQSRRQTHGWTILTALGTSPMQRRELGDQFPEWISGGFVYAACDLQLTTDEHYAHSRVPDLVKQRRATLHPMSP